MSEFSVEIVGHLERSSAEALHLEVLRLAKRRGFIIESSEISVKAQSVDSAPPATSNDAGAERPVR